MNPSADSVVLTARMDSELALGMKPSSSSALNRESTSFVSGGRADTMSFASPTSGTASSPLVVSMAPSMPRPTLFMAAVTGATQPPQVGHGIRKAAEAGGGVTMDAAAAPNNNGGGATGANHHHRRDGQVAWLVGGYEERTASMTSTTAPAGMNPTGSSNMGSQGGSWFASAVNESFAAAIPASDAPPRFGSTPAGASHAAPSALTTTKHILQLSVPPLPSVFPPELFTDDVPPLSMLEGASQCIKAAAGGGGEGVEDTTATIKHNIDHDDNNHVGSSKSVETKEREELKRFLYQTIRCRLSTFQFNEVSPLTAAATNLAATATTANAGSMLSPTSPPVSNGKRPDSGAPEGEGSNAGTRGGSAGAGGMYPTSSSQHPFSASTVGSTVASSASSPVMASPISCHPTVMSSADPTARAVPLATSLGSMTPVTSPTTAGGEGALVKLPSASSSTMTAGGGRGASGGDDLILMTSPQTAGADAASGGGKGSFPSTDEDMKEPTGSNGANLRSTPAPALATTFTNSSNMHQLTSINHRQPDHLTTVTVPHMYPTLAQRIAKELEQEEVEYRRLMQTFLGNTGLMPVTPRNLHSSSGGGGIERIGAAGGITRAASGIMTSSSFVAQRQASSSEHHTPMAAAPATTQMTPATTSNSVVGMTSFKNIPTTSDSYHPGGGGGTTAGGDLPPMFMAASATSVLFPVTTTVASPLSPLVPPNCPQLPCGTASAVAGRFDDLGVVMVLGGISEQSGGAISHAAIYSHRSGMVDLVGVWSIAPFTVVGGASIMIPTPAAVPEADLATAPSAGSVPTVTATTTLGSPDGMLAPTPSTPADMAQRNSSITSSTAPKAGESSGSTGGLTMSAVGFSGSFPVTPSVPPPPSPMPPSSSTTVGGAKVAAASSSALPVHTSSSTMLIVGGMEADDGSWHYTNRVLAVTVQYVLIPSSTGETNNNVVGANCGGMASVGMTSPATGGSTAGAAFTTGSSNMQFAMANGGMSPSNMKSGAQGAMMMNTSTTTAAGGVPNCKNCLIEIKGVTVERVQQMGAVPGPRVGSTMCLAPRPSLVIDESYESDTPEGGLIVKEIPLDLSVADCSGTQGGDMYGGVSSGGGGDGISPRECGRNSVSGAPGATAAAAGAYVPRGHHHHHQLDMKAAEADASMIMNTVVQDVFGTGVWLHGGRHPHLQGSPTSSLFSSSLHYGGVTRCRITGRLLLHWVEVGPPKGWSTMMNNRHQQQQQLSRNARPSPNAGGDTSSSAMMRGGGGGTPTADGKPNKKTMKKEMAQRASTSATSDHGRTTTGGGSRHPQVAIHVDDSVSNNNNGNSFGSPNSFTGSLKRPSSCSGEDAGSPMDLEATQQVDGKVTPRASGNPSVEGETTPGGGVDATTAHLGIGGATPPGGAPDELNRSQLLQVASSGSFRPPGEPPVPPLFTVPPSTSSAGPTTTTTDSPTQEPSMVVWPCPRYGHSMVPHLPAHGFVSGLTEQWLVGGLIPPHITNGVLDTTTTTSSMAMSGSLRLQGGTHLNNNVASSLGCTVPSTPSMEDQVLLAATASLYHMQAHVSIVAKSKVMLDTARRYGSLRGFLSARGGLPPPPTDPHDATVTFSNGTPFEDIHMMDDNPRLGGGDFSARYHHPTDGNDVGQQQQQQQQQEAAMGPLSLTEAFGGEQHQRRSSSCGGTAGAIGEAYSYFLRLTVRFSSVGRLGGFLEAAATTLDGNDVTGPQASNEAKELMALLRSPAGSLPGTDGNASNITTISDGRLFDKAVDHLCGRAYHCAWVPRCLRSGLTGHLGTFSGTVADLHHPITGDMHSGSRNEEDDRLIVAGGVMTALSNGCLRSVKDGASPISISPSSNNTTSPQWASPTGASATPLAAPTLSTNPSATLQPLSVQQSQGGGFGTGAMSTPPPPAVQTPMSPPSMTEPDDFFVGAVSLSTLDWLRRWEQSAWTALVVAWDRAAKKVQVKGGAPVPALGMPRLEVNGEGSPMPGTIVHSVGSSDASHPTPTAAVSIPKLAWPICSGETTSTTSPKKPHVKETDVESVLHQWLDTAVLPLRKQNQREQDRLEARKAQVVDAQAAAACDVDWVVRFMVVAWEDLAAAKPTGGGVKSSNANASTSSTTGGFLVESMQSCNSIGLVSKMLTLPLLPPLPAPAATAATPALSSSGSMGMGSAVASTEHLAGSAINDFDRFHDATQRASLITVDVPLIGLTCEKVKKALKAAIEDRIRRPASNGAPTAPTPSGSKAAMTLQDSLGRTSMKFVTSRTPADDLLLEYLAISPCFDSDEGGGMQRTPSSYLGQEDGFGMMGGGPTAEPESTTTYTLRRVPLHMPCLLRDAVRRYSGVPVKDQESSERIYRKRRQGNLGKAARRSEKARLDMKNAASSTTSLPFFLDNKRGSSRDWNIGTVLKPVLEQCPKVPSESALFQNIFAKFLGSSTNAATASPLSNPATRVRPQMSSTQEFDASSMQAAAGGAGASTSGSNSTARPVIVLSTVPIVVDYRPSLTQSQYSLATDDANKVGSGSFGTVRRAMHNHTSSLFVVKTVAIKANSGGEHSVEDGIKKQMTEVRFTRQLHHPNLVECFGGLANTHETTVAVPSSSSGGKSGAPANDANSPSKGQQGGAGGGAAGGNNPTTKPATTTVITSGTVHLFMNHVGGGSLQAMYEAFRISDRVRDSMIIQILHALGYLHALGIVHRDIKSANCLKETTLDIVRVADFGCSLWETNDYGYHRRQAEVIGPRLLKRWEKGVQAASVLLGLHVPGGSGGSGGGGSSCSPDGAVGGGGHDWMVAPSPGGADGGNMTNGSFGHSNPISLVTPRPMATPRFPGASSSTTILPSGDDASTVTNAGEGDDDDDDDLSDVTFSTTSSSTGSSVSSRMTNQGGAGQGGEDCHHDNGGGGGACPMADRAPITASQLDDVDTVGLLDEQEAFYQRMLSSMAAAGHPAHTVAHVDADGAESSDVSRRPQIELTDEDRRLIGNAFRWQLPCVSSITTMPAVKHGTMAAGSTTPQSHVSPALGPTTAPQQGAADSTTPAAVTQQLHRLAWTDLMSSFLKYHTNAAELERAICESSGSTHCGTHDPRYSASGQRLTVAGSPEFMAPEIVQLMFESGNVHPRLKSLQWDTNTKTWKVVDGDANHHHHHGNQRPRHHHHHHHRRGGQQQGAAPQRGGGGAGGRFPSDGGNIMVSPASDIWSLGCVMVELLRGGSPYPKSTFQGEFIDIYNHVVKQGNCPLTKEVEKKILSISLNSVAAANAAMGGGGGNTRTPSSLDMGSVSSSSTSQQQHATNMATAMAESCIDFLRCCFERDFMKRPSAVLLLQHPFLTGKPFIPPKDTTVLGERLNRSQLPTSRNTARFKKQDSGLDGAGGGLAASPRMTARGSARRQDTDGNFVLHREVRPPDSARDAPPSNGLRKDIPGVNNNLLSVSLLTATPAASPPLLTPPANPNNLRPPLAPVPSRGVSAPSAITTPSVAPTDDEGYSLDLGSYVPAFPNTPTPSPFGTHNAPFSSTPPSVPVPVSNPQQQQQPSVPSITPPTAVGAPNTKLSGNGSNSAGSPRTIFPTQTPQQQQRKQSPPPPAIVVPSTTSGTGGTGAAQPSTPSTSESGSPSTGTSVDRPVTTKPPAAVGVKVAPKAIIHRPPSAPSKTAFGASATSNAPTPAPTTAVAAPVIAAPRRRGGDGTASVGGGTASLPDKMRVAPNPSAPKQILTRSSAVPAAAPPPPAAPGSPPQTSPGPSSPSP